MPKGRKRESVVTSDQVFGGKAYFAKGADSDKFKAGPSEGRIEALVGTEAKDKLKKDQPGGTARSGKPYEESEAGKKRKKQASKAKSTVDEMIEGVKEAIKKPGGALRRENY